MQLFGMCSSRLTIPFAAILAERGRRRTLIWVTAAIALFGLVLAPIFTAGTAGAVAWSSAGPDR